MPGPQSRRVAHASITVPEWWHLDQTKVNIVLNGTLRAELCKNTRCFVKLPEWECPNGEPLLLVMIAAQDLLCAPSISMQAAC